MKPCPICSQPMAARYPSNGGKTRKFCSRSCGGRANAMAIRTRNADLDEVAVIRLISGSLVASTKAERIEAVRVLTARGLSAAVIAKRLHTTPRSVWRYRAEFNRREVAA